MILAMEACTLVSKEGLGQAAWGSARGRCEDGRQRQWRLSKPRDHTRDMDALDSRVKSQSGGVSHAHPTRPGAGHPVGTVYLAGFWFALV